MIAREALDRGSEQARECDDAVDGQRRATAEAKRPVRERHGLGADVHPDAVRAQELADRFPARLRSAPAACSPR